MNRRLERVNVASLRVNMKTKSIVRLPRADASAKPITGREPEGMRRERARRGFAPPSRV